MWLTGEKIFILRKTTIFEDNWGAGTKSRPRVMWQDWLEIYGHFQTQPLAYAPRDASLEKPAVVYDINSVKAERGCYRAITGTQWGHWPSYICSNFLKCSHFLPQHLSMIRVSFWLTPLEKNICRGLRTSSPAPFTTGEGTCTDTTYSTAGERWALLHNRTQWKPVWVQAREQRQGTCLCPQLGIQKSHSLAQWCLYNIWQMSAFVS